MFDPSEIDNDFSSVDADETDTPPLRGDLLCPRGDGKPLSKEQQLALFADRTSTQALRSNQLRLYFSSFAYVLIETLRALGLGGTELAQAQCDTTPEALEDQDPKVGAVEPVTGLEYPFLLRS